MKNRLRIASTLLLVGLAFAQTPVPKSKPEAKPLAEVSKLRLLNSYQAVVIVEQQIQVTQNAEQSLREQDNRAIAAYHAIETAEAKTNGLPEGTTFRVNNGEVAAVLPEVKAEVKPEVVKK